MDYAAVLSAAQSRHLTISGAFHPSDDDGTPQGTQTLVLLSPLEPGFWNHFKGTPEAQDSQRDPMDRWSTRIITGLAAECSGTALFPFGGPPWHPFIAWATKCDSIPYQPHNASGS